MAILSHVIEARKTAYQASVLMTGGPWTTVTLQTEDLLPPSPGITHNGAGVFTVSSTGAYLLRYFLAYDMNGSNWPSDVQSMGRVIINGATPIPHAYSVQGHYTAYGRNGGGCTILTWLTAGQNVRLQYRVNQNQTQYAATPAPGIGGELTDTGDIPGGPAVTTFGLQKISEPSNLGYRSMYLTANTSLGVLNTWTNFTGWFGATSITSSGFAAVNASGEWTIPSNGHYLVGYHMQPDMLTTGALANDNINYRLLKNGSEIVASNSTNSIHTTLGWNDVDTTFIQEFASGDLIKMQGRTNDVGVQWAHFGGQTGITYREYVSSMFIAKVANL